MENLDHSSQSGIVTLSPEPTEAPEPISEESSVEPTTHPEPSRSSSPASLAAMLVEAGMLSPDQVAKVQEIARRERQSLGRILVRDGLVLSHETWPLSSPFIWA